MAVPLSNQSSPGSNRPADLDRRQFLKASGAATLAATSLLRAAPATQAGAIVAGKVDSLIIHAEKPAVLETPLELLDRAGLTPLPSLFVRNNQQLADSATLKPLPLAKWTIELKGLVDRPQIIKAEELLLLEQVEYEMVLQCCGNARSQYSKAAKTHGTQWGFGAMGNVRFAGVPLAAVLTKFGIKVGAAARFVAAEGQDEPAPGKLDFEHSLPLDDVLKKSILALRLNGEPLPAIHGGPVRLVTPGYYASVHMKWLHRLRFEDAESSNYNHSVRYRMPHTPIKPGQPYEFTLANSRASWQMKLVSVILSPENNAKLAAGSVKVRGVAFNDGQARIETVLVSFDRGRSWQSTSLESPASPYAWYRWSTEASLKPGTHVIWARAVDALGRSQPLDGSVYWNPDGYEWNGAPKVEITVN
jgi:DMSO/TMAO reductase YedYZ molybdopterin-dependent catalytic subunit